jgi:hypothetical protein
MQKKRKQILCALCILILLSFAGCATMGLKNYGSIVPDGSVMEAFDKFHVNPNYNYYYSGSEVYPSAVIGLDNAYALDSDLWKKAPGDSHEHEEQGRNRELHGASAWVCHPGRQRQTDRGLVFHPRGYN